MDFVHAGSTALQRPTPHRIPPPLLSDPSPLFLSSPWLFFSLPPFVHSPRSSFYYLELFSRRLAPTKSTPNTISSLHPVHRRQGRLGSPRLPLTYESAQPASSAPALTSLSSLLPSLLDPRRFLLPFLPDCHSSPWVVVGRFLRLVVILAVMSLLLWWSRRASGLAIIALVLLCYWVISKEWSATRHNFDYSQAAGAAESAYGSSNRTTAFLTAVFAYYSLFVHFLMCLFPARSCWAIFDLTRTLKKTARSKVLRDFKLQHRWRGSSASLESAETLTSSHVCSASSSEAGDIDLEPYSDATDETPTIVIHAIIIPNYKEEVDTLRETLDVLATHPQAQASYDVGLPLSMHFYLYRWKTFASPVALRRLT